MGEVLLVKRI